MGIGGSTTTRQNVNLVGEEHGIMSVFFSRVLYSHFILTNVKFSSALGMYWRWQTCTFPIVP